MNRLSEWLTPRRTVVLTIVLVAALLVIGLVEGRMADMALLAFTAIWAGRIIGRSLV